MPPTSLLYPHQPAKLNLSNSFNLDPTFSDPSILVSALSSLKNYYFLALFDSGPFRTLTLSSWIWADDLFMDSKLAKLQIPLLELSTPITLRLLMGTPRIHGWNDTTHVSIGCLGWWSLTLSYCLENCSDGSSRIQGLGKPPDISKTFESPLAPDSTSTPVELSPIDCSLSDSISLESMQADVYPFVEVSPVSDVSVPPDILSSFSSLFSEDQAETLPPHRDFDCSIELKPGSEPFHGKIYQLTREEDKSCKNGSKTTSEKVLFGTAVLLMAHLASL
ncbi:hypothetical protein BASA83_011965 [Batrachochytrium salamandrivorans]|nr:hypothetical protein BASA83_011965 [Batrachochytrium salamandrivorans]